MAYFCKNNDGNFDYSYYGIDDCIPGEYVTPECIEIYIQSTQFFESVKNSYKQIDLTGGCKRDADRFNAKKEKAAEWLREKAHGMYF